MTELAIDHLSTPVGNLYIVTNGAALCALGFPNTELHAKRTLERHLGPVRWRPIMDPLGVTTRLRDYFSGDLNALTTIPVVSFGTPFQRQVWDALRRIPIGATVSYRHIAEAVGSPTGYRAVGMANGRNPVSIVVPCHRVIGANSALTGYSGGLDRKAWLLAHERANMNLLASLPPA